MKIFLTSLTITLFAFSLQAQQYITRSGKVSFLSETAVEDIKAINNQVSSVLDLEKGSFAFLVPIKGFTFEKALMQEHFNENYMESEKYPKASYKGKIVNSNLDLSQDGQYEATFQGTMTIHGTDQPLTQKVTLTVEGGKLSAQCGLNVKPADYNIKIPSSKQANISDNIDLTVMLDYEKK